MQITIFKHFFSLRTFEISKTAVIFDDPEETIEFFDEFMSRDSQRGLITLPVQRASLKYSHKALFFREQFHVFVVKGSGWRARRSTIQRNLFLTEFEYRTESRYVLLVYESCSLECFAEMHSTVSFN